MTTNPKTACGGIKMVGGGGRETPLLQPDVCVTEQQAAASEMMEKVSQASVSQGKS